jgi:hypothetical protein
MYHTLLSEEHQRALHALADDPQALTMVTLEIRVAEPTKFFHGDEDAALKQRVFFHKPTSNSWSGTYLTDERAYGNQLFFAV